MTGDETLFHLAEQLEVQPKALGELAAVASGCYHRFPLPKPSGGKRWIEAPDASLRDVQRKLLKRVLYALKPHTAAHGFVPGRSIVSNAMAHVGRKWVASFDVRDFFPSTKEETVRSLLGELAGPYRPATECIVSLVCLNGSLPQGAPTSPHLANLAFRSLDRELSEWACNHGLSYTRYADDLTFSGNDLPRDLDSMVERTLGASGYGLARRKTRYMGRHRRQMVTGLVVNDRVGLPRPQRRRLRAIIHRLEARGPESLLNGETDNGLDRIRGHLALEYMCNDGWSEATFEHVMQLLSRMG